MKKKFFLSFFLLAFASQNVYAIDAPDQNIPTIPFNDLNVGNAFDFHGNATFGYDYSFGFAKVENGKVLKDPTNNLVLDDRFRNYIYTQNVNLAMRMNVAKFLNLNLSGALVSNGFNAEPLYNPDSYKEYAKFLDDRKKNIKNIWQRYAILQDINIVVKDQSIDGSLTVGQQLVPFGYSSEYTMTPNVVTSSIITPMTEYINYNVRGNLDTPYQNSSLTNLRDIGLALAGNYSTFKFVTALYNGAGPNTLDNNNEKDIFARVDYVLPGFAEAGVTHWRGRHIGYKTIYAENPGRVEYEMSRTGLHAMLGNPNAYLMGEFIFSQDNWYDKSDVSQLGWYVEGTLKAPSIVSGTLRYESLYDNNILKNQAQTSNYTIRRFVVSSTQSLANNIRFREEYVQSWEDYFSKAGDKASTTFGFVNVSLGYTF